MQLAFLFLQFDADDLPHVERPYQINISAYICPAAPRAPVCSFEVERRQAKRDILICPAFNVGAQPTAGIIL
jgi:hypothetical protein